MPWTADDSYGKTHKANTPKRKRMWAHVADSVLERGGSEKSAIMQASGVVGNALARAEKSMKRRRS